jgi:hypothetical protein
MQKSLIFMCFHGVFLGNQHDMWSQEHNGTVSLVADGAHSPRAQHHGGTKALTSWGGGQRSRLAQRVEALFDRTAPVQKWLRRHG